MNKDFENLTRHIPYYAHASDVCLLDDGSVFTGLKLTGLDTVSMTPDQLATIKGKFKNVFENLPHGFVVQIFHDYDLIGDDPYLHIRNELKSEHPTAKAFRESYLTHLSQKAGIRQADIYLFLIWPAHVTGGGFPEVAQTFMRNLKRILSIGKRISKKQEITEGFQSRVQEILNHTQRVQYSLKNILSVDGELLNRSSLVALMFKLLNPGQRQPHVKNRYDENEHECPARYFMTLREEIAHSGIEEHADFLKIGNRYACALSVKTPSRFTQEYDSEIILNSLNFPFSWSFSFRIIDTAAINAKLEARQRRKHAFVVSSNNPNISSALSKGEIEKALADQKTNGFNWYEASLSFLIYGDSPEHLKDRVTRLVSVFRDFQESILIVEKSDQMSAFLSTLPGLSYRQQRRFLFSSLNVSDLAPISEPPRGTKDLSCYFQSHRGTLFRFSTFSNEFNNWNQAVIGKIGSGKSFIVNNILNMALMNVDVPRVMILDLGQSFKRTTQLWGGEYLTIDLDHPDSGLNPLPPIDLFRDKDETVLGLLDFTVTLLLLMAGFGCEKRLHARIVKRAVLKTYESVNGRSPIMEDLHKTLTEPGAIVKDEEDRRIAIELAKLFEDYVGDGPYARLFNRQSTLTHRSDFFCFDFKNANQSPHIREIATYIVGGYICRKMVENPFPKFIIFDEFSTTMKHETGATLCELIAKNCRKHGVSFITISQEVDDFLKHKSSQTLYKQSNFKWFLRMDDDVAKVQEALKINNTDVGIIRGLNTVKGEFAEVYLVYGNNKALLRLSPDPLSYWACTTDARDKILLEAYLRHFENLPPETTLTNFLGSALPDSDTLYSIWQVHRENNSLLGVLKILARLYPKGVTTDDLDKDGIYQNEKNQNIVVKEFPSVKKHKKQRVSLNKIEEKAYA